MYWKSGPVLSMGTRDWHGGPDVPEVFAAVGKYELSWHGTLRRLLGGSPVAARLLSMQAFRFPRGYERFLYDQRQA